MSRVESSTLARRCWEYGIPAIASALILFDLYRTLHALNPQEELNPDVQHQTNAPALPKYLNFEKPDITFEQIGGLETVKETIKIEVTYPRLRRDVFELYGRQAGNGVLLWGPPGCGKTLLAKATAKACGDDVSFVAPSIGDIMSKWVGESEKIIDRIFRDAEASGNCVIFLDEIDAIAPRSGPSYVRRIKDTLLQNLDGVKSKKRDILVLGATNRPWLIDPAIRRPGRLGKVVMIPPPDAQARKSIFSLELGPLLRKGMISSKVNLEELAALTEGFSAADVVAICQKAVDIPLMEAVKGSQAREVEGKDFGAAMHSTKKSIIPWLSEAISALRRYNAVEFLEDINSLTRQFGLDGKVSQ